MSHFEMKLKTKITLKMVQLNTTGRFRSNRIKLMHSNCNLRNSMAAFIDHINVMISRQCLLRILSKNSAVLRLTLKF